MKLAKTDIVIDKSFLQGAPKDILQSLFKNHRVLMTEALFYELLTTTAIERARCFSRIPSIKNPVVLVQNVGAILRWEVRNQQPLTSVDHVAINIPFQFNRGLTNNNFSMNEERANHLENWKKERLIQVCDFAEHACKVTVRFPELKNYRPGGDSTNIKRIKKRVCTETEFVLEEFYNGGLDHTWPPAEDIDERWALFRWIQIRVVTALDYFHKYGEREVSSETTKIENEYVDLEYCLIGCLVGAIATQDKGMAKRFLALCPSGTVNLKWK